MNCLEINNRQTWNTFVSVHGPKSGAFLQSFEWGEFQKKFGRKIWRLGLAENGTLDAGALLIKYPLPLGKSYLYCPRGPIVNQESRIKNQELLIEEIKKIAEKENSIFIRSEPPTENSSLPVTGYGLRVKSVQPEHTLVLDLTKFESDLLAAMHPKTRYNIRLAQRHGVTVHRTRTTDKEMLKNDFENFWNLLSLTAKRDGFRPHSKNYYWLILNSLTPQPSAAPVPNAALYLAKYHEKILAANLVMFFGDTATYLHGASSNKERHVMAPHLLHWQIIKEAKRLGFKFYDFWGIDEAKWPGITRFKKGFGGFEISYPGTFDLPIQKNWYKIYSLAKKFYK